MLAGFEWRARNPVARREHGSLLYLVRLLDICKVLFAHSEEWLKARGDPGGEKTFINDAVGKAYRAQGESAAVGELRDRAAISTSSGVPVPPARYS